MSKIGAVLYIALTLSSIALGHTWLSCTKMVNGQCQGYIRNYQGRNTGSTGVDDFYTNKDLGRTAGFQVCKSDTQRQKIYSAQYPMATAYAGETLNVMYTPNGHSQPGDHGRSTTSRIHWTGSTTSELVTREQLTDANKIGEWNYASNCATTGDFASLPCVNGFQIPAGTAPGTYQVVWWWPYDRDQNQRPLGEDYYSCFDVQVLGNGATPPPEPTSAPATSQQRDTSTSAKMGTSAQTSQNTPTTASNTCSTILDDCKSFCAPSTATVCECDPITGKKTLRCGAEEASSAVTTVIGMPVILMALLSLL